MANAAAPDAATTDADTIDADTTVGATTAKTTEDVATITPAAAEGDLIRVEVAYAKPDEQLILAVNLPRSASPAEAVAASLIAEKFPEIQLDNLALGVFGKAITAKYQLREGDRIEIYRPLIADPKEARRRRAEAGKLKS